MPTTAASPSHSLRSTQIGGHDGFTPSLHGAHTDAYKNILRVRGGLSIIFRRGKENIEKYIPRKKYEYGRMRWLETKSERE
jgi:hypothetical protein